MKENELRERLKALYPDIPAGTHAAFMQAAASERKSPVMKQKLRFSPVLVILMLLMLTAVAYAVSTYSVRDLDEFKKNPEQLKNHLLNISQRFENEYIAVSVNDTTFDGLSYAVALNLESKRPGEYVFVKPRLAAESGDEAFWAEVEGFAKYDFEKGFLFPDPREAGLESDAAAFNGTLMSRKEPVALAPNGPVSWTLTLDVYRLDFEPVLTSISTKSTLKPEEYTSRMRAMCQEAYRNGQFLVNTIDGACDLETYTLFMYPIPGRSLSAAKYYDMSMADKMAAAGAMEKVDTIECRWTTHFGTETRQQELIGQRLRYDIYNGFDLVLDEFNLTYRQLNCEMHIEFDKPLSEDSVCQLSQWIPCDWAGRINGSPNAVQSASSRHWVEERDVDGSGETQWVLRCIASMVLNEEARTAELVPYQENSDGWRKYYPELGFMVDLEAGTVTRSTDAAGTLCPPEKWASPPPQPAW